MGWQRNYVPPKGVDVVMQDYILSPLLRDEWEEALTYYEKAVFSRTGKKVLVVKDIHRPLSLEDEKRLEALGERFSHMIVGAHQEDLRRFFSDETRLCARPDQPILGPGMTGEFRGAPICRMFPPFTAGGTSRNSALPFSPGRFDAAPLSFDCHVIEGLGKMGFDRE
jgi:hypothetical protein